MDAAAALRVAEKMYAELVSRRSGINEQERYFRGEQPLAYASDEWSEVHKNRYKEFSDNWCGVVGSAPAERLGIQSFSLDDDSFTSDAEKALWLDWERNEGGAQASQGFLTSTIAKRSFALVWGDANDEPLLSWEHPSQVIVGYDPETRERTAAVKAWSDDETEFLTLYTADEVFKWHRSTIAGVPIGGKTPAGIDVIAKWDGGGWEPRQSPSDDTWPIRNPLGEVPVVEYANRPMLGGEPLSDIDGTIAMQDAVNMLWAYLFVAADYASMPARVVMGQEPPRIPVLDENGAKVGEKDVDIQALKKGRMLWLTGQATSIGQWDAAKLDVFTNTINVAVKHIAAQTKTPIYLIHGELGNVNGETLTGLDAPLVSKVQQAQDFYRRPVRDTFALMAKVRGDDSLATRARVGSIRWNDPAVHSPSQLADAASKDRQLGLPLASILENRYGYSQPQIDRIMQQIRDEQTDPYLAKLAAKDAASLGM